MTLHVITDFLRRYSETIYVWSDSTAKLLESLEHEKRKTDAFWFINGGKCKTEMGVYKEFSEKLFFPDYFGKNWDAFIDCMLDMQWRAPGKNNHYFIVDNAFSLTKLESVNKRIFFQILNELEKNWNYGLDRRRGFYRFILCIHPGQLHELIETLLEFGVVYQLFQNDGSGDTMEWE